MRNKPFELPMVRRIQPLLSVIAKEITARETMIRALEYHMEELTESPFPDRNELRSVAAEAALNHRELRHARAEIARLGCSVVGLEPVTVRVPTRVGDNVRSVLLQFTPTAA